MLLSNKRDNRTMKEINYSLILKNIKIKGPISRTDLAEATGLNPSTISRTISKLEELNLVKELSIGESQGGRRPMLLGIDESRYHIVGIDIGATKINAVVVNLLGEVQEKYKLDVDFNKNGLVDISLEMILASLEQVMARFERDGAEIIGIGVGMHGLVDKEEGELLFAPNFGWRDVPLERIITDEFGFKTIIDNDVRVMALGESWFGAAKDVPNFICVNVGYGIGSGIMIFGRLYRGTHSMAGEVGHTTVDEDGHRCNCGNYGCLEGLASGPAIARETRKQIKMGRQSVINSLVAGELQEITAEIVHQAAQAGDPLAQEVFANVGSYLGVGLSNMVNILDPELLIIGGGVSKAEEFIFPELNSVLELKSLGDSPRVTRVGLGDDAGAIGASVLVMEELFELPLSFMQRYQSGR